MDSYHTYANLYKDTLLRDVIPFWEQHSIDDKYGGYFTCLDRQGQIYDTDKFSWLQTRQIWTFSMLFNKVASEPRWLEIAKNGVDFVLEHGQESGGNLYFSTDQSGKPLTHAFNIYSDCFAALAFGEYAKATEDEKMTALGASFFHQFISRQSDPKGRFEKRTANRPLENFGFAMMTAYLTSQLNFLVNPDESDTIISRSIDQIVKHYDPNIGVIREFVRADGTFEDSFDGRLINPGHGIEAMWFLMDIAAEKGDLELIDRAINICLEILNYSWDQEYGGIFYFLDAKKAPMQQLEWDQKLWWVHQEALIALSRAFLLSSRSDVWVWYEKVHEYAWAHFHDPDFGEWYGYLKRGGEPLSSLKGGKWKGCFHTPRAMYECWQNFDKIQEKHAG